MKYLLHFIGSLLLFAIFSMAISVVCGCIHYLLSLLSLVDKPTWQNVFGGAGVLFACMVIYGLWSVIILIYRFIRYPDFFYAFKITGIKWKSYKRIMSEKERKNKI